MHTDINTIPQNTHTSTCAFCVFLVQIDIPLSPVFYKWMLGQELTLTSADLHHIDPILAKSFLQLEDLVHQKKHIYANRSHVSGGFCVPQLEL